VKTTPLGIYVHVPFCRTRCRYCDFYRVGAHAGRQREFLAALLLEIERLEVAPAHAVDTVFLGGGTPSLLAPDEVAAVLEALRRRLPFAAAEGLEITLEANPSDAEVARLSGYRAAGVNRLSLGVQSFGARELRLLGRRHDGGGAVAAVAAARAAGFENLSLDLMLGIPGQTEASWRRTLERAIALAPEHLSLYILEVHGGSEMDFLRRERPRLFPGEEAERRRYLRASERLAAAGYRHYEISNFARRGRESRHNLKYWRCEPVLGLGPAAHSLLEGRRSRRLPDLAGYVGNGAAGADREPVPTDLSEERLFLGLRLADGVAAPDLLRATGLSPSDLERRLERLRPFVARAGDRVHLTRQGFVVSTPVIAALLETEPSR
jgi:oxygen-independent coproporphyrinogen-3 oxidase